VKSLLNCVVFSLIAFVSLSAADIQRGIDLFNSKNYAEAEKVLRAAVTEDSENMQAQRYLGLALLQLNRGADAVDPLGKAAEAAPDDKDVQAALARAYVDTKQYEKAQQTLDALRALDENNPEVPYVTGMMELQRKQYAEAARDLETAIQLNPENAYAHYYAGIAYNALKRPDKVTSHFETFLKLAPQAAEAPKVRSLLKATR
jgi:tetratricopeptide (TPR) repeat protein